MRLLSIMTAGTVSMVLLTLTAAASPLKFEPAAKGNGRPLHLAQSSEAAPGNQLPCEEDPNCVAQEQQKSSSEAQPAAEAPSTTDQPPAAEPTAPEPRKRKQRAAGQEQPQPATEGEQAPRKERRRVEEGAPAQPPAEQPAQPADQPAPQVEQQQAQPEIPLPPKGAPQRAERNRQNPLLPKSVQGKVKKPADQQPQAQQPQSKRPRLQQGQVHQPGLERPRQPQQSPQPQQRQRPQDNFAGLLRDNRPASALTDAELRRRIGVFGQALQSGRLDGRMENRVRAMLDTDRGELDRRISATTGRDVSGVNADREARNLLQDRRPAARLNDDQLRDRVGRIRAVLSLPGLDPRSEEQLRRLLADDRDELRSRVALAQQPEKRQRFGSNPAQIDRRALRKNMFEAREERRRRLADPSYRIVIPNRPVKRRAPMPTIPLAEAYDQQLLDQLMAPPAYPIDRRYTIEEYRANPSLRTLMPGIEVDTVKFGFNEDFLREEEIVKLDRIGELMERIIAGNPNEAFVIEGHTDLVGSADYNEALSWRRADAVRQALTEFFYIPEQNLEIVGYGEQYPRIPTEFEEPENRRVTIRRITPILYGQQ